MKTDRKILFDKIRPHFGGRLNQGHVDGINVILNECEAQGLDLRETAYVLETAKHETAHTMQPVRETLATSDAQAIARLDAVMARGLLPQVSRPYWRDGWFGRGFVQLTHEANYRKAGEMLGIDLVAQPSRAMDPVIAASIIVRGMKEGWFTGHRLNRYFTATGSDWVGARRIVNGLDRAAQIGNNAKVWYNALSESQRESTGEKATAGVIVATAVAGSAAVGAYSENILFGVSAVIVVAAVAFLVYRSWKR